MVDLVKVRKKAKEKAEGKRQKDTGVVPASRRPEGRPEAGTTPDPASKLERFLETAGQRRSVKKTTAAAVADHLELLTFYIAGELYAIDIENVVEIITTRPVTRIPNADPSVVGILSLRGTVVTLIDVRRRLGHTASGEKGDDVRVIVVQQNGEHVGFAVDRVLRVVKADTASIEPHPVVHASEHDESVRGVFRQADVLTILLDLERLVSQD